MLKTDQKQFHLPIAPGEVGKYCILPGDPDRCERIAAHLQNPVHLGQKREYNLWNGTLCGELVTVCSTGIGGPSTAIAIEELANCGAHTMIRPALESSAGYWTDSDDLTALLYLALGGRIDLGKLISEIHSPEEAQEVFTRLADDPRFPIGVLFDWHRV